MSKIWRMPGIISQGTHDAKGQALLLFNNSQSSTRSAFLLQSQWQDLGQGYSQSQADHAFEIHLFPLPQSNCKPSEEKVRSDWQKGDLREKKNPLHFTFSSDILKANIIGFFLLKRLNAYLLLKHNSRPIYLLFLNCCWNILEVLVVWLW